MSKQKVVILDGTRPEDKHLDSILALLIDVLQQHNGTKIQKFTLQAIKINHCIGCFNCWLKTPGRCIHHDAGVDILRAIQDCTSLFFFSPIVFGGYSSELKKIVDRFLPMSLPFFKKAHGETHHLLRYPKSIRFFGIGV
ncbi:MAG: flavodoxin family protein, partial [Candidatus Electrothrix sp. ATG2]|nr:flavodoxin family protein [Candidatus Electrothrix sp. ATG2]